MDKRKASRPLLPLPNERVKANTAANREGIYRIIAAPRWGA
jgi:hypothetical protein